MTSQRGHICEASLATRTWSPWRRSCLSGFPPNLVLIFSLSTLSSSEGSHHAKSTLKEWRITLQLPEGAGSTEIIRILLQRRFVSSHPFIRVFHSFIYINMNSWIFALYFGSEPSTTSFISLLTLSQLWPLGALSVGSVSLGHGPADTLPCFLTLPDVFQLFIWE